MTAFFTKAWQWVLKTTVKYIVRYVVDHVVAWNERRLRREAQQRQDEATKKPYDQAVQNGTKEEVRNATTSRYNS